MASAGEALSPEQQRKEIRLADRVNRISVSPTLAALMEAERLKARGVDVVDFGPGEPDFPTPDHIKRAAVRAIEENRTKYTATVGIAPLREAACAWRAREFGSSYTAAECIVSVGGKHALFNIINAMVQEGDEVAVPAPYWVSYPDIVKLAGGAPVFIATREEDGFRLRASDVEKAIGTRPGVKLLIVNSPNNPTGAVIPDDEFERILDVCRRRGVWLVSDECYSHFLYGGAKPFSIAGVPGAKEHVIIAASCSKTFAMTGWRIGYTLAPKPIIDALLKLQSQSTSNPTSIAQYAALEALSGPMDSVSAMLAEYARRRERIVAGLEAISGIRCAAPDGAFYVFPDVRERLGTAAADSAALSKQLLEREHIAVVPGEAFGAPGFLRFSYATSMARIDEGLWRLERFFAAADSET